MPEYRFGDVVYAPVPYVDDQNVADDRTAVVISSNQFNDARDEVIIMEITSRLHQAKHFGAFMVEDWQASGLKRPSVIKPLIFSVGKDQIKETWGHLDPATEEKLKRTLPTIFGFRTSSSVRAPRS